MLFRGLQPEYAELAAGVQMAFVSLFESSTEPESPCNFKRTTAWQKRATKMTQGAYEEAQTKRAVAIKKEMRTCIPTGSTKRLGDTQKSQKVGKCQAGKLPQGHIDALRNSKVNIKSLKTQLSLAYANGFPIRCCSKSGVCRGRWCFKFQVSVKPRPGCPDEHDFTIRLRTKGRGASCGDKSKFNKNGDKCQIKFMGGCKKVAGARAKTSSMGPVDKFYTTDKVYCQKAVGTVRISNTDTAATKQQGNNNGPEVPMIWSQVEISATQFRPPPGADGMSLGGKAKAMWQAVGALVGGNGILEPNPEKMARVCGKLHQQTDALVRAGIAAFRFKLYKRLTGTK